jgi:hypothetical protein
MRELYTACLLHRESKSTYSAERVECLQRSPCLNTSKFFELASSFLIGTEANRADLWTFGAPTEEHTGVPAGDLELREDIPYIKIIW